ncbi:MAG: class I SAM-dependent methyltransferase [Pseudomonadota bacterium]
MTFDGLEDVPSKKKEFSKTETHCRSCGVGELRTFLDLGETPLANRLLNPEERDLAELAFPLKVAVCENCGCVQITETVAPEVLFADQYPYYSSAIPALLKHSRENALGLVEERKLGPDSLVIELASNDGYLLKNYVEKGVPVLGIDPAENQVAAANEIGVRSMCAFFSEALGETLAADGVQADVIHANNVLAHVADTNSFVGGVAAILKEDGVAVIECPYLLPMIEKTEFDTVYHEHYFYWSVTALDHLFRRHGLYLNRIKHLTIHGGSLRLFVEKMENQGESVADALAKERALGADKLPFFKDFGEKVAQLKTDLVAMIKGLRAEGKTVAAYAAAAKGATLVNYAGIDHTLIDFTVDRAAAKQNMLMPGSKIPIHAPEAILERKPDYVLMLAWNFADEILQQQSEYRAQGGKFIIPVPTPHIV